MLRTKLTKREGKGREITFNRANISKTNINKKCAIKLNKTKKKIYIHRQSACLLECLLTQTSTTNDGSAFISPPIMVQAPAALGIVLIVVLAVPLA